MDKNYILDNKTEEEHNKYLFEIEKGKFINVKELLLSFEDLQNQVEDLVKQLQQKENIINIKNDYIIQLHNLIYKMDNPNLQFALHIKQEKYLKELKEEGNK